MGVNVAVNTWTAAAERCPGALIVTFFVALRCVDSNGSLGNSKLSPKGAARRTTSRLVL